MCGVVLVIQVISGLLLSMHYIASVEEAYNSVEHIMRDVPYGWMIRYFHSSGSSIFFIVIYIHMARSIYYRLFNRTALWCSGLLIFILVMACAFLGYVLPWGMMSFWGATVITNLFGVIPLVGSHLTSWLWGGFSIEGQTLRRFYSLHFVLPFVVIAMVFLHLVLLHEEGSSNPLGTEGDYLIIPFYPYYFLKDLYGAISFLGPLYVYFVFFNPHYFMHPVNYVKADPLITPPHIQPEWYFLWLYAILRAIPNKSGGVFCMFGAIIILFFLPWIAPSRINIPSFSKIWQFLFWMFVANLLMLGMLGARVVEEPYVIMSQLCTFYYFFHLLVLSPVLIYIETRMVK